MGGGGNDRMKEDYFLYATTNILHSGANCNYLPFRRWLTSFDEYIQIINIYK